MDRRRQRAVHFPLRPHLHALVTRLHGPAPAEFGDARDTISTYVRTCLARRREPRQVLIDEWAKGREPYTVLLTYRQAERYGGHVRLESAIRFEQLVDALLVQLVRQHLASSTGQGTRIERIERFMQDYNMDPLHLDAASLDRRCRILRQRIAKKNSPLTTP